MPPSEDTVELDETVFIAGYGLQEDLDDGVLEFLPARVTEVTDSFITVVAGQGRGACLGDSGGPLFRRGSHGFELLGLLSRGSASCTGYDDYVRTTALAGWLEVSP